MKVVLGAIAAVVLAGAVFSTPAEARCFWNGFGWQCWHHPHHHYWGPPGPPVVYYRGW